MTEEAAIVRGILANPDDDVGRLAYADWLDEYGTTDRQRARAEWIRLVCWTPTRKDRQTGRRLRVRGERAWLRENAHRLWPHVHALKAKWWKPKTNVVLLTGNVVLGLALAAPYRRRSRNILGADVSVPSGETIDHTRVSIFCERGVTSEVYVTFLRAERVAVAAARDEPFADLKFATLPDRCYADPHNGHLVVYRTPFLGRGLLGVWDAIEGERFMDTRGFTNPAAAKATDDGQAVNKALTSWARHEAANPLRVTEEKAT